MLADRHPRPARLLLAVISLGLLSCTTTPRFAVDLQLSQTTIAPDSRGDRVDVRYSVNRPSRVNLRLLGPAGASFDLRTDEARSAGQSYVYGFNGSTPSPNDPEQRRVLGDGTYRLVLEATDASGQREQAVREIALRNADVTPPSIENLAVFPSIISPNFDGVDDVATMSYRLTKQARVQSLVTDESENRVHVGAVDLREPGEYADRWDGIAKEKPLADGVYTYHVRATDAAGNVVVSRAQVQIQAGGRPDGRIVRVDFTPRRLMAGDVLTVRAQVRNTGLVPLRTQGPDPMYRYSSFDSFASIAGHQLIDRVGTWRLGVDWAGSPTSTGSKYPYRWGFGRDLPPGEEVTVEGQLRVEHGPALDRQVGPLNNRIFVYAGLVHEGIAFQDDRVGGTWIELGY
jgi:hypothetical protein